MKIKMYVIIEAVHYSKYGSTDVFVDNDMAYLSFDEGAKSLSELVYARYEQTKMEFANRSGMKADRFVLHVDKMCQSCHGQYVVADEDGSEREVHTFGLHRIDTLDEVEG